MGRRSSDLGPGFSAVLSAAFITNLGDGLRLAALPLLARTLTSSPLAISGVTAAQFLPWTTFALVGGVLVDRLDRRRLILTTQTWRAAVMALLAVAVLTDRIEIWHLFVVAYVITVGEILVDPSVVAMLPKLVRPHDLDRANSRITSVETVTNDFAGGPVGSASFTLAPWLPFAVNAASYLGSTVPFRRLPTIEPTPAERAAVAERPPLRVELGEGLRWIRHHPFLRPLTAGIAVFHLGTAGAFSLLVLLVKDVLDGPDLAFGIALAAAAIGATGSSLLASRLTERLGRRAVITGAAVVAALTVLAAGLAPSLGFLVTVWGLNGAAGGVLLAIGRGFVQRHTPNERLGRTAIASRSITRTSFVVGALLAGLVADASSVRWSFVVAGSLHLAGALLLWRSFRFESADAPTW
ncbi:MAG: MFS transporter [Actinomycetota bacterium]